MAVDGPAIAAEFVGTFVLVFSVGCNVSSGNTIWGGVSIAFTLMVMIYAFNKVSDTHFNPAVSIAMGVAKQKAWVEVWIYVFVQIIAGLMAGLLYHVLFHNAFQLEPVAGHALAQVALAEVLYTFMLCFVVLNMACLHKEAQLNTQGHLFATAGEPKPKQSHGLAIGLSVLAGAYAVGSISGGVLNPAVAIGVDVASAGIGIYYCVIYTFFECIGAALAAGAFYVCHPEELESSETAAPSSGRPLPSILFSEFLGTYMLVVTAGLNVLAGAAAAAFSIASALACMIFALGSCSGAHFNPAVTVAVLLRGGGKITGQHAVLYILMQIIAAMCGAVTYSVMMSGKTFPLGPPESTLSQVFIAEFVFTFVLAFVVLSVCTVHSPLNQFDGFAIGMCVMVGAVAVGKISGGALNPAVSVGVVSAYGGGGGMFFRCLVYGFAELLGGAAAAGAFKVTQPSEMQPKDQKTDFRDLPKDPYAAEQTAAPPSVQSYTGALMY